MNQLLSYLTFIGASRAERQNGMAFATKFLQDKRNPLCPVTVISQKKADKNQLFQALFA